MGAIRLPDSTRDLVDVDDSARVAGRAWQWDGEKVVGVSGTTADLHYTHDQVIASATWVVAHNLGKKPSVTVLDSSGRQVFGGVVHNDPNTTTLTFSAPFSGTAEFN